MMNNEKKRTEEFHIQRFPSNPLYPAFQGKFYWGSQDSGDSGMGERDAFEDAGEAFNSILKFAYAHRLTSFNVHICEQVLLPPMHPSNIVK